MRTTHSFPCGMVLLGILVVVALLGAVLPAALSARLPKESEAGTSGTLACAWLGSSLAVLPRPILFLLCGLAAVSLVVSAFCLFPRRTAHRKK